jgi:uncharacterized protein RhaS with RHS repeats
MPPLPATGQFTQEDPIGLAGGFAGFGYANGDPLNLWDPFGLDPCKKDNTPAECRDGVRLPSTTVRGYRRRLLPWFEGSRSLKLSAEDLVQFAEEIESERILMARHALWLAEARNNCGRDSYIACPPVRKCRQKDATAVAGAAAIGGAAYGWKGAVVGGMTAVLNAALYGCQGEGDSLPLPLLETTPPFPFA